MKNIQIFYQPDDIHQHFHRKWKTDLFRQEHQKTGSFIHDVMQRVAKYPLFTYNLSDHPQTNIPIHDKTEWRHFSIWWGGVNDYPIDNPLNDTYWLHEFGHRISMSYLPDMSLPVFKQKMAHNEVRATLISMFEVYFHYPELRSLTFSHEILADRFLRNKDFMKGWKYDPAAKREQIFLMLRDAAIHPNPNDSLEHFIYQYTEKNKKWAEIWSKTYNLVETKMDKLQSDIQSGADRVGAMDDFMAWLQSDKITKGTEIPFPDEAIAYAAVYHGQAAA